MMRAKSKPCVVMLQEEVREMERAVILPGLIIAAASSNLLSDRILF
jgi:hypothetical protein